MTGVDRTAQELMRAYLDAYPQTDLACLLPASEVVEQATRPQDLLDRITPQSGWLNGLPWEQLTLTRAVPDRYLLGLCNTGPMLRRRQVVMIHDGQVFDAPRSYSRRFRKWYRVLLPKIGHRAALVLTVSNASRDALIRHAVAPRDRIKVVPNGVDHIHMVAADDEVLVRHKLLTGRYFLTIGSSAYHKNSVVLARALSLRGSAIYPLVVVGDARPFEGCDGTLPLGLVSDGELRALYENARGFLLPSLTEGFGLPAGEAMLCGCPVIASTGGALPEVCGSAAAYADPSDPSAWAAAMDENAGLSDAEWQDLRDRSRAQAARWTWAASATALHEHLSELPPIS